MIIKKPCTVAVLFFVAESTCTSRALQNVEHNPDYTTSTTIPAASTTIKDFAVIIRPSGCEILRQEEIPMTSNPAAHDRALFLRFKHEIQCLVASAEFESYGAIRYARQCDMNPRLGDCRVPASMSNYELLVSSRKTGSITAEVSPSSYRKQVTGDWNLEVNTHPEEIMGATMFVVDIKFSGYEPSPSSSPSLSNVRSLSTRKERPLWDLIVDRTSRRRTGQEGYNVPDPFPGCHELA